MLVDFLEADSSTEAEEAQRVVSRHFSLILPVLDLFVRVEVHHEVFCLAVLIESGLVDCLVNFRIVLEVHNLLESIEPNLDL